MCNQCVEAVQRHFPDCPDSEYGDFLLSATSFPAGTPEQIDEQLMSLREKGATTWTQAIDLSYEEFEKEFDALPREEDGN